MVVAEVEVLAEGGREDKKRIGLVDSLIDGVFKKEYLQIS